ncbi:hypothetical protein KO561_09340 [Radiobacillus kanasensis]|uniref:hypothetical protein n=1 Tax=Radiobacillus kanasensis TaxID=2844358 RepID=UPI001E4E779B|nr:hypothetical protein [Radiobacillus kanasensis]UFU01116.1 hypothetical protein KO561_09340 [Radiobacillus kanasensis]
MDEKDVLRRFSDFELKVIRERLEQYTKDIRFRDLKNLLFLIVEEINIRNNR